MIPKVIHYCWFGGKKKSKLIEDCIRSWKHNLPDYEIKEWNEKNTDLTFPFVKDAYKLKKWAFVADYIRLKVLYDYGGIYLDTDMYLIKSLDIFLNHNCFFGAQDDKLISAGVIGAIKHHIFIKKCLSYYEVSEVEPFQLRLAIPRVITRFFLNGRDFMNIKEDYLSQKGVYIYSPEYFYPMPYVADKPFDKNFLKYVTKESAAIHLWEGSWVYLSEFKLIRRKKYLKALKLIVSLKPKLNFDYLKKITKSLIESILK